MRPSPELEELRERLQVTAGELGQQLEQLRRPPVGFEMAPAGDRLEEAAEDYIAVSNRTADAILDAADDQDDEAIEQLTRLIGLDLEVAQRLIGHAAFEGEGDSGGGPESFIQAEPDPALLHELDALEDLGSVASQALRARPEGPVAAGFESAVEAAAEPGDIDEPIATIVNEAARTISATLEAVAWVNVPGDFVALAGRIGGEHARRAVEEVVDAARGLWKRASRLAAEVLGALVEKITRLLGSEALKKMVDAVKDTVGRWWKNVPGEGPASQALGLVLQREEVRKAAQSRLTGAPPERVAAAVAAAEKLAAANHDSLSWVRRGNKALDWAGVVKPFVKLTGAMTLIALVGAALVTYTAWVAHDHLDSPTFADQLPDRVRGVRQTVDALVGG